jgi:undecaprenyl-diphosphatase
MPSSLQSLIAPMLSLDASVADWLHRHPHELLTQFMLVVTHLHGIAGTIALSLAVAAFLVWRKHWYWLLALAVSVPGGMLLNVLLKHAYHRNRPVFDDPLLTLGTYSFPSGHTANATLFYGFLAAFLVSRVRPWRWRAAICALALLMILLVGFSRMYLGVHYLSDVIAAFAAMLAWLAVCLNSVDALRRHRSGRRLIA